MNRKKIASFILTLLLAVNVFAQKENSSRFIKNNILVEYVSHNGGVLFYYVDKNGKKTPVLDTVDFGVSSFTGVMIDKNYYNLKTSGGVLNKCQIEENSLSVIYNIAKKVQLAIVYTVSPENVLNITYELRNLDGKEHTVSIKSIFDTCLGEWNGTYLSTEAKQKIKGEYIISDYKKHKTLTSTDGITGIRFMMDKDFGKYAYKTVVAAKPFFESDTFDGFFVEGRGFNTVLSYNNSCVGFFFKSRTLKADKDISFSQRIEFAQAVITSFKDVEDEDEDKLNRFIEDDETGEKENNSSVESKANSEQSSVQSLSSEKNKTESDSPEKKTEKLVDKDKALELINRINQLEDSGKNTNRQEIIQLQSELNLILNSLKNGQ